MPQLFFLATGLVVIHGFHRDVKENRKQGGRGVEPPSSNWKHLDWMGHGGWAILVM